MALLTRSLLNNNERSPPPPPLRPRPRCLPLFLLPRSHSHSFFGGATVKARSLERPPAPPGGLPREERSKRPFAVGARRSVITGEAAVPAAAQVILTPDPRMSHYPAWS